MASIPTWHRPRELHTASLAPAQQHFRPSPLPVARGSVSRWRDSWRGIVLGLAAVVVLYTISQFESGGDMETPRQAAATGGNLPSFTAQRSALYDRLAADLETNGLRFLAGGDTTQNMKLSDIFTVTADGEVTAVLQELEVPVRANVLYIDPSVAQHIWESTQSVLGSIFPSSALWYQDPKMYHMSMYHASHDKDPIPATPAQVLEEAEAVEGVVNRTCPPTVEMDRVVVTSTGVVMGLWQLLDGSEPALLRDELKQALPRSPRSQIYNRVILHTSFARILGHPIPRNSDKPLEGADKAAASMAEIQGAVAQLNRLLTKTKCAIRELWYVEEHDLLALALRGKLTKHSFNFQCPAELSPN